MEQEYTVVICDDEKAMCDQLRAFLDRYSGENEKTFHILEYRSGTELLKQRPEHPDLLLLDIGMKGDDGIATARTIRETDPDVCIIFVTTMFQRAIDGYEVRAFGFLKKPLLYVTFSRELTSVFHHIDRTRKEEYIYVKTGLKRYKLPVSQIVYCEIRDHQAAFHTTQQVVESRMSMAELEKKMKPYGFFRCHQSFLPNHRFIERIDTDAIRMKDGSVIPVSQRRRSQFLAELSAYIGEQI